MEPVRVLIADDHTLFREGLRALLLSAPGLAVVGEAASGAEAVSQAAALQPDIILMDIQMPGLNGIEAARRILQESPHVGIVILTMFEDDDSVFAAMRAGARGYLLKDADQSEVLRAILAVANGEALFDAAIARRLVTYFQAPQLLPAPLFPELTGRERQVLDLLAQGYNNPEIAYRLGINSKTVRNHVSNILNKLQVADRAEALIRARDAGLGKSDL